LYNLRDDVGEQHNLAERLPDRAAAMRKRLHAWILSCGSPIPGRNPNYDPRKLLTETKEKPTP
jgi:hypothetical protein